MKTPQICKSILICLLFLSLPSLSQTTYFGDKPVSWENNLPVHLPEDLENYSGSDLVCISDRTEFYFYSTNNEKLTRHLIFKINTAKGLESLKTYKLPE